MRLRISQRTPLLRAAFAAQLALAAPAAAHVIGPGSGRSGASVAALLALIGVISGALAAR